MQHKRRISMMMAAVMAVSLLTACGSNAEEDIIGGADAETEILIESGSTEAAATDVEDVDGADTADTEAVAAGTAATVSSHADLSARKVGVSIYRLTDDFMSLYRTELAEYLESLGFSADNIQVLDAADDSATQVNQIQRFLDDGVDILIVNAVDPAQAPAITDLAVQAGVPLIYINREPADEEETRWQDNQWEVTYVGGDAAASGTMQGEIITALDNQGDINGDGTVSYLMIEGDSASVDATERTSYSVQALQASGLQTQCIADGRADWDRDDAYVLAANELAEHGSDIEVVLCNNDAMALGALEAIREAGRTVGKDIYLVGCDALEEALEDVIAGTMTGTVFNDYIGQSHAAADAAVNYITGAGNSHYIGCDYLRVTRANAQDVLDSLN